MGRSLGFVGILIVLAAGAGIYMRQAQVVTPAGAGAPSGAVDLVGVKHDLIAIARAERAHNAVRGGYVSIDELRSYGDLTMERNNRGPYTYSAEVSGSGFVIIATFNGPESVGVPRRVRSNIAATRAWSGPIRVAIRGLS